MDLRGATLGFYRVWLASAGASHGLFERLHAARSPAALAREARLDADALARWLRAAHAVGLLERGARGYRVPPSLRAQLDPADPDALVHQFRYVAEKSLGFGALPALLEGRAPRARLDATYALATAWDHVAYVERVVPRERDVARMLHAGARVLDLGAGHGGLARLLAERFPRARIVAAETRAALPALRKALRGSGIETRDASRVEPSEFDLVVLCEVLGASGDASGVLRAARDALRPGGIVHALEGLRPPERRAPRGWGERLVVAMDFDFALDGSRFLPRDEALAALRDAGLVRRRSRDVGGSLFLLAGRRPLRSVQA